MRRRGRSAVRDDYDGGGADPRRLRPEAAPLLVADHRRPRLDAAVEHGTGRGADDGARGRCEPDDVDAPGPGVGTMAARLVRGGLHHRRVAESGSGGRLPTRHNGRDVAYHLAWGRPERLT